MLGRGWQAPGQGIQLCELARVGFALLNPWRAPGLLMLSLGAEQRSPVLPLLLLNQQANFPS